MSELVGDESGRIEVELYGEIDAIDFVEVVKQPPRPTPEDEPLDERVPRSTRARSEKHEAAEDGVGSIVDAAATSPSCCSVRANANEATLQATRKNCPG
jgi:hypothetical protein